MELSENDIKKVLGVALKRHQDVNLISYRLVSKSPNGFNGLYYTVVIKYSSKNNDDGQKEVWCFAKMVPANERHVEYIRGTKLLQKEHEFFSKIAPTFRKFTNFDLPVPKCYLLKFDESDFQKNMVILEDLSRRGFETRDPRVEMTLKECSLVVAALAKLHAASIIAEQKGQIRLREFLDHPDEALWTSDETHPAFRWVPSAKDTVAYVAKNSKFAARFAQEGAEQKLDKAFKDAIQLAATCPTLFNCVCHGDIWNNNLMFKFAVRNGGQKEEAVLVDMQVYRLAPPITDVLMFIFLNSSRELRDKAMDQLLLEYWQALEKLSRDAGCVLPPEMADLVGIRVLVERFRLFGLVAAAGYVPMCQLPPEARIKNAPLAGEGAHDFDVLGDFLSCRGAQVVRGMEMSPSFKCRLLDTLEELFDFLKI